MARLSGISERRAIHEVVAGRMINAQVVDLIEPARDASPRRRRAASERRAAALSAAHDGLHADIARTRTSN